MIRLENLTKEYDLPPGAHGPAQVVAADHVNLEIPAGEIFGLVGPNGAGKTTTLKMLCGLLVPTSGRVSVNQIDVEKQPEEAQKHIGYLADFFSCYDDLIVWEYFDYFARAYKMEPALIASRIDYVIGVMGLEPKRHAFISGLSRGMKQRVGIGRAILHDPPVLVLDEPASGLDPKARLELKLLIKELNRPTAPPGAAPKPGKTVFITSHVLSDLEEICTSVGILEKGKLVRVGPLDHVLRGGGTPEGAAGAGVALAAGRKYRVKLAAPWPELAGWLAARAGVSEVKTDGGGNGPPGSRAPENGAEFVFAGTDTEVAALVRDLVLAGAPVCHFEEELQTLEQLYFKISSGEVM